MAPFQERTFQSDWPGPRLKSAQLETGLLLRVLNLFHGFRFVFHSADMPRRVEKQSAQLPADLAYATPPASVAERRAWSVPRFG